MPTPIAPIIDAAETIADGYIAATAVFGMVSLFVAFAVGQNLVGWFWKRGKKVGRG